VVPGRQWEVRYPGCPSSSPGFSVTHSDVFEEKEYVGASLPFRLIGSFFRTLLHATPGAQVFEAPPRHWRQLLAIVSAWL